jgi:hypothetical protein
MTERHQPLYGFVIELACQSRTLGSLCGRQCPDRGVHSTMELLDMLPQHVDRPTQVVSSGWTDDGCSHRGEITTGHGFGTMLEGLYRRRIRIAWSPFSSTFACVVRHTACPLFLNQSPSRIRPRWSATVTASVREATSSLVYVFARWF